jgi:ankyrin repeat protein
MAAARLRAAAAAGNLQLVQRLVNSGHVGIDFVDQNGRSALHYAAYTGRAAVVRFLLSQRASTTIVDVFKRTPLDAAKQRVRHWPNAAATLALQEAADALALHTAAAAGDVKAMKACLVNNSVIDVDATDDDGRTSLHVAARSCHSAASRLSDCTCDVHLCYLHSAHANVTSNMQRCTLHRIIIIIISRSICNFTHYINKNINNNLTISATLHTTVSLLLEYGASGTAVDSNGETPLHFAARADASYNNVAAVKVLLASGGVIDAKKYDNQTVLHVAAAFGKVAVIELLLREGATLDARTSAGWTPLIM